MMKINILLLSLFSTILVVSGDANAGGTFAETLKKVSTESLPSSSSSSSSSSSPSSSSSSLKPLPSLPPFLPSAIIRKPISPPLIPQPPPPAPAVAVPVPVPVKPLPSLDRVFGPIRPSPQHQPQQPQPDRRNRVRIIYDREFQMRCIDAMNRKRLWHDNTPPLIMGDNFTQYTIDRAWSILADIQEGKREIVKGQHPFGESFFYYYDPTRYRTVEEAINIWYEESRNYDYSRPEFSARTGGFTQLIWRGSREATCVKIELETPQNFRTLIVANFWPAGNVKGEFPQNVLPLRPTRPDLVEQSLDKNRPWPRPPYQPPTTELPTYPTYPLPPSSASASASVVMLQPQPHIFKHINQLLAEPLMPYARQFPAQFVTYLQQQQRRR